MYCNCPENFAASGGQSLILPIVFPCSADLIPCSGPQGIGCQSIDITARNRQGFPPRERFGLKFPVLSLLPGKFVRRRQVSQDCVHHQLIN